MEVCIVGAGFSGIIASKICKDHGFLPYILEKCSYFGGIWGSSDNQSYVWPSLRTNTSKYLTGFSDQPWSEDAEDYPSSSSVRSYLQQYVEKHSLQSYFHYNCTVIKIKNHGEDYLVRWKSEENTIEKVFKYVLVCNGYYSAKYSPVKNMELFRGTVIHSEYYQGPSIFTNKRVVIVGSNVSACEIALQALEHSSQIFQICRSKQFIFPKYHQGLPLAFTLNSVKSLLGNHTLFNSEEKQAATNRYFLEEFGNPGRFHPSLEVTGLHFNHNIADAAYFSSVSEGRINIIQGNAFEFYSDGIILEGGEKIEADTIVLCTGYCRNLAFLGKKLKTIIRYESESTGVGMSTFMSILHPNLPGFGFIGAVRSTFPCRFELQSRVALKWLQGTLDIPHEELVKFVESEHTIRCIPTNLNTFYNPFAYTQDLMKILDIHIDLSYLEHQLHFKNPFFLPQLINLDDPETLNHAKEVIRQLHEKYPQFIFNSN